MIVLIAVNARGNRLCAITEQMEGSKGSSLGMKHEQTIPGGIVE